MSCQCVISADSADDLVQPICNEIRKARKQHTCYECREVIQARDRYEYFFGMYDGDRYQYSTCMLCVEIRTFFSCDGTYMWGSVWEDIEEHLFDHFHHGCLDPTPDSEKEPLSAEAKQKVVNRWMRWKGLAA